MVLHRAYASFDWEQKSRIQTQEFEEKRNAWSAKEGYGHTVESIVLKNFSDRRLILVTGKGGTGKSVIATALALALSTLGKRVLLTEIGRAKDRAFMRLHELVGATELNHSPRVIVNPIDANADFLASRIDPLESLLEYMSLKLRSSRLPSLLLKNKITGSFLEVIPGLTELMCLGKLLHLASDDKNREIDTIVLDAPASGHAMTLLNSPQNFSDLTRVGPVYNDTVKMVDFLKDDRKLGVVYCSLPEEMPLQESKEFCARYEESFTEPFVFINKVFPTWEQNKPLPNGHPCHKVCSYVDARKRREKSALDSYRSSFRSNVLLELPFLFSNTEALSDSPAVHLARQLRDRLGGKDA